MSVHVYLCGNNCCKQNRINLAELFLAKGFIVFLTSKKIYIAYLCYALWSPFVHQACVYQQLHSLKKITAFPNCPDFFKTWQGCLLHKTLLKLFEVVSFMLNLGCNVKENNTLKSLNIFRFLQNPKAWLALE